MSETPVVKVEQVSKKYCRRLRHSLWYGVVDLAAELTAQNGNHDLRLRHAEFLAVDDVSFDLRAGECVGLIGHNGAGKSTLLKMLNGLVRPDKGKITMRGRVGALIELGAGFSPILTGRENIYINGAVLGFSKYEIDSRLEQIVDFAELGDFIDSPVHSYSSGMYVRLGFAIAAQLDPDILLVDEILAVGDAAFRLKCMRLIRERVDSGMTMILVSHDMRNVMNVCTRAIWMDNGAIREIGLPKLVCANYEKWAASSVTAGTGKLNITYFDPSAGVRFIDVLAKGVSIAEPVDCCQNEAVEFEFQIETTRSFPSLFFNYALRTIDDVMVLGAREPITLLPQNQRLFSLTWRLAAGNLLPGTYKIEAALAYEYRWGTHIQELRPACIFTVVGTHIKAGVCDLPVELSVKLASPVN